MAGGDMKPKHGTSGASRLEPGDRWAVLSMLSSAGGTLFDRMASVSADPFVGSLIKVVPTFVFSGLALAAGGTRHFGRAWPRSPGFAGNSAVLPTVACGILSQGLAFPMLLAALRYGGAFLVTPMVHGAVLWAAITSHFLLDDRLDRRMLVGCVMLAAGLGCMAAGQAMGIPVSHRWVEGMWLGLGVGLIYGVAGTLRRWSLLHGLRVGDALFLRSGGGLASLGVWWLVLGKTEAARGIPFPVIAILLGSGGFALLYDYFTTSAWGKTTIAKAGSITSLSTPLVALVSWGFLGERVNLLMCVGLVMSVLGAWVVHRGKGEPHGGGGGVSPDRTGPVSHGPALSERMS
ncbi:MAG: DMT family transporter [Bacillota bacterium]